MSWMEKNEEKLLRRSFFFGMTGILSCLIPLFNRYYSFWNFENIQLLTGIGIGLQLFGLSIVVLVLRKRRITQEVKDRAQRMVVALAVALIFFMMI